jgi:TusA-related sulfurtransferase
LIAMQEPHLDLRGTPCPLNYVRARLALEKLPAGGHLLLDLDAGEPERMVQEALRGDGHRVERIEVGDAGSAGVRLRIGRG